MATLAVQKITPAGTGPTYGAAAGGGDQFTNDGRTQFHVKNGSGSSINVTVNSIAACSQGFDHDLVVAVPAGGERMIGPFEPARFNDSNGLVSVTYSAVTTVTVAPLAV